jgi:hypothetical protein
MIAPVVLSEKSGNGWPGSLELVSTELRSCRAFLLNTLPGKSNLKVLFSYFQLNRTAY